MYAPSSASDESRESWPAELEGVSDDCDAEAPRKPLFPALLASRDEFELEGLALGLALVLGLVLGLDLPVLDDMGDARFVLSGKADAIVGPSAGTIAASSTPSARGLEVLSLKSSSGCFCAEVFDCVFGLLGRVRCHGCFSAAQGVELLAVNGSKDAGNEHNATNDAADNNPHLRHISSGRAR
jgi:hypothetical protein